MGLENNCTKHAVRPFADIPSNMKTILDKLEKLNAPPMGRVLDNNNPKCPICIYELGYDDGYNEGLEDGEN